MKTALNLLILSTALICCSGAWAEGDRPPVEAVGGVSLPGVPPAVAAAAVQASAAAKGVAGEMPDASSVSSTADTNITLTVVPGTTDLVRIARGYLNRVITPFEDPKLLTVNAVEVKKEGASLYLTTASERPVGVHILSNDPEDTRSISLTLIPARIPPKTITLRWPEGTPGAMLPVSMTKARRWEESAPYEEKLFDLVEQVAQGKVPDGYALGPAGEAVDCKLPGVEFYTGQRLTGAHFSIFVLRATNVDHSPIEILSQAGCDLPGVALVAPWPRAYLEPNESTEVYVAVVNEAYRPQAREQIRPSLLVN